jgi:glycosyltransferase involved in cell wall biosynthesis
MVSSSLQRAIFVTNRSYLATSGGGVQWCTREYIDVISAAGFELDLVEYDVDRRPFARIRRKLTPRPYKDFIPPEIVTSVERARERPQTPWVFLNNSEPLELAADLVRASHGTAKIVYLSHGAELTDQINALRLDPEGVAAERARPVWLGRVLHAEIAIRKSLAAVICLSEEDVAMERLLGARATCFLPRTVALKPLDRKVIPGRIGTVSTLNHTPNCHGIRMFAEALDRLGGATLRLVGRPEPIGHELAARFRSVEYVGSLCDAELEREAATWAAFVNPIFCPARGASTKVAQALGWGIPVVTTREGARGYRWSDLLPLASGPRELAALAYGAAGDRTDDWSEATQITARSAPSIVENATRLLAFLKDVADSGCDHGSGTPC